MKGRPANIFEMNTSIATLSIQCSDENSLYLEGKSDNFRMNTGMVDTVPLIIWLV